MTVPPRTVALVWTLAIAAPLSAARPMALPSGAVSPQPPPIHTPAALHAIVETETGTAATNRIPDVHTTSLAGQSVDLPAQLVGHTAAVLVLGFSKGSRTEARDWGRRLATDFSRSPAVLYYEMPVLAAVPKLLRPWVLRQIATEVSDDGKPHFAPITDNEARWRTLARVSNPESAYILLVDRNGNVVSTHSGPLTDPAYDVLHRELNSLPGSPPR